MAGTQANGGANIWETASEPQFFQWKKHHDEIARYCYCAFLVQREAAELKAEYTDILKQEQRLSLAQNDRAKRQQISDSKKALIRSFQENARIQELNVKRLRDLQRRQTDYVHFLDTVEATLTRAENFNTNRDKETYLDLVFGLGSLSLDAVGNESTPATPRQPIEPDRCPICLEDFENGVEARPLQENTAVALAPCCKQKLHRNCLERWWDTDNDEQIRCPVCRQYFWEYV